MKKDSLTTVEKEEGPRSFATFLAQMGDGEVLLELSRRLHEMGRAIDERIEESGKGGGTLTLSIKFSGDRKTIAVHAEVTSKVPAPSLPSSVFWLTPGSNFSAENPRQTKLPLRDASDDSAPSAARSV